MTRLCYHREIVLFRVLFAVQGMPTGTRKCGSTLAAPRALQGPLDCPFLSLLG